jgi:hypothetical protein
MNKPTGKPRGRPRKTPPAAAAPKPVLEDDDLIGGAPEDDEVITDDLAEVYGGVSAHWLAQMFGADKNTIKKKLASSGIEIVGRRNGGPLYRLKDAAAYLVTPKVDLVSYVKSLRPNDLPPMLNDAYWGAMLKRQKWEENAGDLWRTQDVLEVLGDLNLAFRSTVNLWVEEVDRINGLTPGQRLTISQNADKLLDLTYKMLVDLPSKRKTPNTSVEDGAMPESESTESAE